MMFLVIPTISPNCFMKKAVLYASQAKPIADTITFSVRDK